MPSFMTTQWTPELDAQGNPISFSFSGRGVNVRPGGKAEMSDRTYEVGKNGEVRCPERREGRESKKERVGRRHGGAKLSKRERAKIQSAQEIERWAGMGADVEG